jgi:Ca2+-binding EF-hand superfamily protein
LAKGDLKDYAKYADALNMDVNELVTAMGDSIKSFGDITDTDKLNELLENYKDSAGNIDYAKFIKDYDAKESSGALAV